MQKLKNKPLKVTPKVIKQQLDEAEKIGQILTQGRFSTKAVRWQGLEDDEVVTLSTVSDMSLKKVKNELVTQLSVDSNIPYEDVNDFIKQWAVSSNGVDKRSLGIQESGAGVFNTELSDWQKGQVDKFEAYEEAELYSVNSKNLNRIFESSPGNLRPGLKDCGFSNSQQIEELLIKTMYSNTQKKFEGVTSVTLYRGTEQDVGKVGEAVEIKTNALESWTLDYRTAKKFSNGVTVLKAEVPVERIVGTAGTGFGALPEWEIVVIGGIKGDRAQIVC